MQRRRDRSSDRRLLLACLTALLTGIVLGMAGAASAVSAPQIDPVPALTNSTAITYTWSGQGDAQTTCELTKDGAVVGGGACSSPWNTTLGAGDGVYSLVVTASAVDPETGQTVTASSLPATTELDTTAPELSLTANQGERGSSRTPSWTVGPDGTTAACVLSGPDGTRAPTTCSGTWTADLSGASEGTWTVTATTEDAAGNDATATGSYVLDVAPGTPTVTAAAPAGFDTSPAWTFVVPSDATAACTLDGPAGRQITGAPCADGYAPELSQGDGQYTLSVVLTDLAGSSEEPGTAVYRLDTVAPDQPVVTGPTGRISAETVTWTFAVPTDTRAECTVTHDLVAGTPLPCGPDLDQPVTDGDWSLSVVLQDTAGNRSTAGDSGVVTIDLTAPPAPVLTSAPRSPNSGGGSQSFTWNWSAEDPSVVECRIVSAQTPAPEWGPCTSGTHTVDTAGLQDGPVTLELRSVDDLGNATTTLASTVVLDTTAPLAPVVTGTGGAGSTPTAVWSWAQDETDRATCRLYQDGVRQSDTWTTCTSGDERLLTEDGTWGLEVRLTDDAGNTGPEAFGPTYVLDRVAPVAPSITAPASPGNEATVSWTVDGELEADVRCELLEGLDVVEAEGDCPRLVERTLTGEGSWALRAVLVDAAGNRSEPTTSAAYVLDLTVPTAPAVDGPTGPSDATVVTWTWAWTGETVTAQCRTLYDADVDADLTDDVAGAWAACTASEDVRLPTDGVWHWQVRLEDTAGNVGEPGTSPAYLLDSTDPEAPTVTPPAAAGSDPLPVFTIDGEAGIAVECRVLSVGRVDTVVTGWGPCPRAHEVDLSAAPDGSYVVEAVLVDDALNRSAVGRSTAYELDTDTPDAPLVDGSSGDSPSPTPTWTWTGEAVAAQCRLLRGGTAQGDWAACETPYTPTLTSEGSWVLEVQLVDAAGNTSDAGTGPEYRYDATAPLVPAVNLQSPGSPGRSLTPSWSFSAETGAVLTCRLVGPDATSDWATCAASPVTTDLTGRSQGTYRYEVVATDAAGNTSGTGRATYVLDTVAPSAASVVPAASPSSSPLASWTLRVSESGLSAQCRLQRDGTATVQDWAACPVSTTGTTWSTDLSGRADGRYRLDVELIDAAGNRSSVAGADYVYDTTAPVAVATTAPLSPGSSRTPTWILSPEAGAVIQCRFDGAATFVPCAADGRYTPDLTSAPDRSYELVVRAVDLAGNVGPETRSTYLLDTTAPATPGVTGPTPSPGQDRAPGWRFTAESGSSAHCTLVRGTTVVAAGSCSTSYSRTLPADGSYVLSVTLTDAAGNVSAVGTASYVLDTTAPALPVIVGPSSPSSIATPVFGFDAESGALVECRVSFGTGDVLEPLTGWQTCAEGYLTVDAVEEGTYRLEVRATDAAGNVSAVADYAYVYDREAPAGLQDLVLPVSPSNDRTPEWSFSAPLGGTVTCRFTGPDGREVAGRCRDGFTPSRELRLDGRYVLRVVVEDANGNVGTNDLLYVLDTTGPLAPTVTPTGATGTVGQVQWDWVGDPTARWQCELRRDGRVVAAFADCVPGVQVLGQWGEGQYTLTVVGFDLVGNRGAEARGSYTWDAAGPAALGVTTTSSTTGGPGPVTWTFRVPSDASVVECGVRRDGAFVLRLTSCRGGSYVMDLTGQRYGSYEVVVRFSDRLGNTTEQVRTYTYVASSSAPAPSRPRPGAAPPPAAPAAAPPSSPAPSRPSTVLGSRLPSVPTAPAAPFAAAPERLRALEGLTSPTPARSGQDAPAAEAGAAPGGPDSGRPGLNLAGRELSGATAVEAIKDVATETIKRPQLPIVLVLLVLGFLLIQNRIDRQDPKLAGAALDGDTELEFRPLRSATAVPPPLRPRAGGAPA